MKKIFRASIFLALGFLLIACGQSVIATPSPIPSPSATAAVTLTPVPRQTATAQIEPTTTPVNVPPTLIPTIDPTLVPELLRKDISIRTLTGVNGHNIRQITGWDYGFRSNCGGYQWLDSNHLFLYPRSGEEWNGAMGMQEDLVSQTVVINLETGAAWLPPYKSSIDGECESPQWSLEHGLMVFSARETGDQTEYEAVTVRTLDGDNVADYEGKLISVSPSGTKILIDDTWIDLISGIIVDFDWYRYRDISPDVNTIVAPPIWSADETQVLICCYFYGNAHTGKTHDWEDYNAYGGTWVKNDKYLLLQYDLYWGADPSFIPLFDPSTNTTLSLNKLAGLPVDMQCPETNVSPNEEYVWVMCYETNYLVYLSDFKVKDFPGYTQVEINWSTDGKFAWIDNFDTGANSGLKILSTTKETLTALPVSPTSSLAWHPTDPMLGYFTEHKQTLTILDANTMSVKGWKLPSTFYSLTWSPHGSHIALTATDGSLWQLDYPTMENLEQLTEPMKIRDVFWSPDGISIAFISGSDIYIVDTIK